jgi:hypothetical protein
MMPNIMLAFGTPDPLARGFLIIVVLSTFAIDVWILRGISRSRQSTELKGSNKTGAILMSIGAIVFLGAVQLAGLTILLTSEPIGAWPRMCRLALTLLSCTGIAAVVLGIIVNLKSAFR